MIDLEKMNFADLSTAFSILDENDDDSKTKKKFALLKFGSRCLTQAIRLNSKLPQAWHDLGVNLFFQSNAIGDADDETKRRELISQSINCLKHAVRLDSSKSQFWLTLANVLTSQSVVEAELAQHCFIKSLSLEPRRAAAWTGLGVLYKKFGEINSAHKCFDKAQSVDPDYANCWIGQAAIAEEIQPKEALDLFRHAVELGNNVSSTKI